MKVKNLLVVSGSTLLFACASVPTNDTLKDKAAGMTGQDPSTITISNVRNSGSLTYFVASGSNGNYACNLDQSSSKFSFGMLPAMGSCTKQ
jgi:hypothetical protein